MSDSFFVNSPFYVTQNTILYAQNINVNESQYDYILLINILAGSLTTMNSLFNTRSFIQNSSTQNTTGENNVDINLSINLLLLNNLLYGCNVVDITSSMSNVTSTAAYTTLLSNTDNLFGLRFLEITATKIFGHAKARAAISNDTDFYIPYSSAGSIIQQVSDGINNSLQNKKLELFNAYVNYDRITTNPNNDVDVPVNFNFSDTNWEFPIYFVSTINTTSTNVNMSYLNNGPYVGGNQLLNGQMNVPILLKFHSTPRI